MKKINKLLLGGLGIFAVAIPATLNIASCKDNNDDDKVISFNYYSDLYFSDVDIDSPEAHATACGIDNVSDFPGYYFSLTVGYQSSKIDIMVVNSDEYDAVWGVGIIRATNVWVTTTIVYYLSIWDADGNQKWDEREIAKSSIVISQY